MPGRHPDPRKVKRHRPYEVGEAAAALGIHKNTILRWIKKDGLEVVSNTRPKLIRGDELERFLRDRRAKGRSKSPPGHIYCFRCRCPRKPFAGLTEYRPVTDTYGHLQAFCEVCETVMCRAARVKDLSAFERFGEVTHSSRQRSLTDPA